MKTFKQALKQRKKAEKRKRKLKQHKYHFLKILAKTKRPPKHIQKHINKLKALKA